MDQEYARNRQLFLMERGYRYAVADEETWGEIQVKLSLSACVKGLSQEVCKQVADVYRCDADPDV